jgi:uncharacterized protein DUF3303
MLYYCAYTWHSDAMQQKVAQRFLQQEEAVLHHPERWRGWYALAGGGSGFLLVETEDPRVLTAMLQPYKVRQRLQLRAAGGRAGTVWWGWAPTMKAVDLWPLVAGLREMDVLDALVWDRAPSHRDADVRAIGLPLVELPPYSPELNPAERLFEEIRRCIEGKVYMTLAEKIAEVAAFLEELDADLARVRRLCGWDWIDAAFEALPAPEEKAA